MALTLLDSFGKRGVKYGLEQKPVDIIDTEYLSKYFVISEFNSRFTAGKNSFALNGSKFLKPNSEILIECVDSVGNNLFIEMAKSTNFAAKTYAYKESTSFILSIHVYNDFSDGIGKLIVYGTLKDGKHVRWTKNITIDKTQRNTSKVRFYQRPTLEVSSIQVPVLSTDVSSTLKISRNFTGKLHGLAVNPPKDTNLSSVNKRNINIDYRLVIDDPVILPTSSDLDTANSQMIGSTINLLINKIQAPFSSNEIIPTNNTASFVVDSIFNNSTIKITDPYFYSDNKNNNVVTNIVDSVFSITYPYVAYNNTTASYLTSNIDGVVTVIHQSYADIIYRNIRSFSGYVARHKIYRKSLLSNGDFQIIADEPLFINELLRDNLTQNKFYELLGKFYNQQHINNYWFTSSNNLSLVHSPESYIDSVHLTSSNFKNLVGNDFFMVKNDSVTSNRNAVYIAFDNNEFLATSGSSYDSNFMEFKKNVQYLIEISAVIEKDTNEIDAKLEFYLTSSIPESSQDPQFTSKYGIKLATLKSFGLGTKNNFEKQIFFFTPKNDLFGTMVIVPYVCQSFIKNISFRVYGDDGFSPDLFISRIPWPISVANETFEIKSELYDINHSLIYSDLRVLQNFDPSGSSLIPFIPGNGIILPGTQNAFISGSLIVSQSIDVKTGNIIVEIGNIFVPDIANRPQVASIISASRFLSVRSDGGFDGEIVFNPVVDISHNDEHLMLATGSIGTPLRNQSTTVLMRQSLSSKFDSSDGRRIYWVNGVKHNDS